MLEDNKYSTAKFSKQGKNEEKKRQIIHNIYATQCAYYKEFIYFHALKLFISLQKQKAKKKTFM